MALTDADRLRGLLGEPVPEGGSADETLFSDAEIQDLLTEAGGNLDRAAYEGWRRVAAHFAQLVDTTEGNAARAMSDLHDHAMKMIAMYARASSGPTEGRTRVGRIRRAT
jgi:hypothetical protein